MHIYRVALPLVLLASIVSACNRQPEPVKTESTAQTASDSFTRQKVSEKEKPSTSTKPKASPAQKKLPQVQSVETDAFPLVKQPYGLEVRAFRPKPWLHEELPKNQRQRVLRFDNKKVGILLLPNTGQARFQRFQKDAKTEDWQVVLFSQHGARTGTEIITLKNPPKIVAVQRFVGEGVITHGFDTEAGVSVSFSLEEAAK